MPEIQLIPIKSLTLLDRNPRKITKEQFAKLCKSLTDDPDFFHNRPVLVNQVGTKLNVYAGNQRVLAAKKLRWPKVPAIIDQDLDEAVMAKRVILDNVSFGKFDDDILSADYSIDILLEAGFEQSYFDGYDNVESFTPGKDADEVIDQAKKDKLCTCPECGHEFKT